MILSLSSLNPLKKLGNCVVNINNACHLWPALKMYVMIPSTYSYRRLGWLLYTDASVPYSTENHTKEFEENYFYN